MSLGRRALDGLTLWAWPGLISVFLLSLGACTVSLPRVPVQGDLAGEPIRTTADSEFARYYLEEYLQGKRHDPLLDQRIDRIEREAQSASLSYQKLREIAQTFSPDFATLFLAKALLDQEPNRRLQAAYLQELERARTARTNGPLKLSSTVSSYSILFAPGWLYRQHPENGADFRAQREFLNRLGADTVLLETEENASVEKNAAVIAQAVGAFRHSGRKFLVVSTSKSGAEVALALGELLSRERDDSRPRTGPLLRRSRHPGTNLGAA